MKKIAVALFLVLVLTTVSAGAESVDLDAMSVEELIALQGKISDEIADRLKKPSASASDVMYEGIYVCGVDIKPGIYLVTGLKDDPYYNASLFKSMEECEAYKQLVGLTLSSGDTYYLELEEGMVLKVHGGSAMITPWVKPSWAP